MKKSLLLVLLSMTTLSVQAQDSNHLSGNQVIHVANCPIVNEHTQINTNNNFKQIEVKIELLEKDKVQMNTILSTLNKTTTPFSYGTEIPYLSEMKRTKDDILVKEYSKVFNGFSGYVTPTIKDNDISLDVCISKSDLIKIEDKMVENTTIQLPTLQVNQTFKTLKLGKNVSISFPLSETMTVKISAEDKSNSLETVVAY